MTDFSYDPSTARRSRKLSNFDTQPLMLLIDNHSADLVLILMLVLIPALMIIFQLNRIDYFPTIGETSNASISVWLMVLQVPKYNEITILTKLIQE